VTVTGEVEVTVTDDLEVSSESGTSPRLLQGEPSVLPFTAAREGGEDPAEPLTWEVAGVPPGLESDGSDTRMVLVEGQARKAGPYEMVVKATDDDGGEGELTVQVSVDPLEIRDRLPDGEVGQPYDGGLTLEGPDGPVDLGQTWRVQAGDPPSGINLDAGTGGLSGTADKEETKDLTFAASVPTDGDPIIITEDVTIVVAGDLLIVGNLGDGAVGEPYSAQLTLETKDGGPVEEPVTWTWSGKVPPLTLDPATGAISGTPTVGDEGVYDFTVAAVDASGETATRDFVVEIDLLEIAIVLQKHIVSASVTVETRDEFYCEIDSETVTSYDDGAQQSSESIAKISSSDRAVRCTGDGPQSIEPKGTPYTFARTATASGMLTDRDGGEYTASATATFNHTVSQPVEGGTIVVRGSATSATAATKPEINVYRHPTASTNVGLFLKFRTTRLTAYSIKLTNCEHVLGYGTHSHLYWLDAPAGLGVVELVGTDQCGSEVRGFLQPGLYQWGSGAGSGILSTDYEFQIG